MDAGKIIIWAVCGLCILLTASVNADPCLTNFGGCDRVNGLCWGTGNDTHFCTCKAGYRRSPISNRHTCEDVDECAENPCGSNSHCQNSDGSYTCECKCGYILDYTGTQCLDAEQVEGLCFLPTRCRSIDYRPDWFFGGFFNTVPFSTFYAESHRTDFSSYEVDYSKIISSSVQCEKGFRKGICGYCEDIDECAENTDLCRGPQSQCINTEGSYYCTCGAGYVLGPCRQTCYREESPDIPELCSPVDLSELLTAGINYRTFVNPIILENYRACPEGTSQGQTTIKRFNLDGEGKDDVILTWACHAATGGGGGSVLKAYAEGEAYWEEWTGWTACKATCWGGVQTRVRRCQNGLPGIGGCEGRGSEKRSCYYGPRCPHRIRKDVLTLTDAEKKDLVDAMRKYKEDDSATGFHNAASAHGWPFQCHRRSCCPHGAKMDFLSWHRSIVLNYEEGLSRYLKDKTLGIPYWNWQRPDNQAPDFAWNKLTYDGGENPFSNMTVLIDRTGPMRTIQRNEVAAAGPLNFANSTWERVTIRKIKSHIMHEFAESTESGHGGPHVAACGSPLCEVSLARLPFAGFDPLFMLHHSQVDRQWAIAQKELGENATWSIQTALEVLEEEGNFGRRHMPFGNTTINPFRKVQAVNNMRDSYYYEELSGVKYDTLENFGFLYPVPTEIVDQARALRLPGDEILFVGHYFQSDTQNFYVNYYFDDGFTPCNESRLANRVQGTLRLGTDRRFRLTVPHMVAFPVRNQRLDIEFTLKACYTADLECRERCPELVTPSIQTMPHPNLIYYFPNTPTDMYKFEWSVGRRMPNWYINLDARSQYLFFYGNRVGNIVQVRNLNEYLSCNPRSGRNFPCSSQDGGNACILPAGIYYLIDRDASHCRNGLRLIIVSRMTHH